MSRRLLLSGLLLISAWQTSAEHATFALLSAGASSTGNQFSAGTLHINNALASGATLSVDNLLAGDSFDAQLDVTNTGSLGLTYALTTSTSGSAALAQALLLTLRARTSNPCSSRDGSVLYTGPLADASLGDPAHGVQAGDRQLGAGSSEALCFTVELPATAPASLHATAIAATFFFTAEQS
jgi:hypothetical protein